MRVDEERFDIVVVGAGLAGLAAASTALEAGARVVVLEAKSRVGGRAYSERHSLGVPFDHGCHWLHSVSANSLVPLVQASGRLLEKERLPLRICIDGAIRTEEAAAQWQEYAISQFERVSEAGRGGACAIAADALSPDPRWDGLFRGWFSMLSGTEPDHVCAADHARYLDTGENWAMPDGYGTFVSEHFSAVPVRLGTPVHALAANGTGIVVHTARDAVQARAAVITVSTGVLTSRRIAFEPRLPRDKRAAIAAVPLGNAEKVGFALHEGSELWVGESHALLSCARGNVVSFQIRPYGLPMISAYFGGQLAGELVRRGRGALTQEALVHLARYHGGPVADSVAATVETGWSVDPDVLGCYSAARPFSPPRAREILAAPWMDRVYFAGEATSVHAYSTAHGAYESGIRAAYEALARLAGNTPRA